MNELSETMKSAEKRMAEITALKTHIIIHKAAKRAFDELGLTKLPTAKSLNAEYAGAQKEMRELLVHKSNIEYILGLDEQEQAKEKIRAQEKIALERCVAADTICDQRGLGR